MTYNYTWTDAEQSVLLRTRADQAGSEASFIPAIEGNIDYEEFLNTNAVAAAYTPQPEPPEPTPLTPTQKLEKAGLTVDELKTLLGI